MRKRRKESHLSPVLLFTTGFLAHQQIEHERPGKTLKRLNMLSLRNIHGNMILRVEKDLMQPSLVDDKRPSTWVENSFSRCFVHTYLRLKKMRQVTGR